MTPSFLPRDLATINLFKRRTVLIWIILAMAMAGLVVRLVYLQVVTGSDLLEISKLVEAGTCRGE